MNSVIITQLANLVTGLDVGKLLFLASETLIYTQCLYAAMQTALVSYLATVTYGKMQVGETAVCILFKELERYTHLF